MKRKTLISILMILILLLQCTVPTIKVLATEVVESDTVNGKVTIILDSNLYAAVKSNLGKNATYSDTRHAITIKQSELESITELYLANSNIDNLKGIDAFTNLQTLDLSSNNLSKSSNLELLNNLTNLSVLDLSSNKIEDVSSLTIMGKLTSFNITNQTFTHVEKVQINDDEDSEDARITDATINLPQIFEFSPYISDSEWVIESNDYNPNLPYVEDPTYTGPYFNWWDFNDKQIGMKVGLLLSDGTYIPKLGYDKLTINIKNTENKLYGTYAEFYTIVYNQEQTAITFNDVNLYNAVKAQLTAGQTMNIDLLKYTTDTSAKTYIGNLYDAAYDAPLTLVINTNILINKIKSLNLAGQKIEDITGIEYFVGIEENLDLSSNYIKNTAPLATLRENKIIEEEKLENRIIDNISRMSTILSNIESYEAEIQSLNKQIEEAEKAIADAEAAKSKATTSEEITNQDKKIAELTKNIATYEKKIIKAQNNLDKAHEFLRKRYVKLYDVYSGGKIYQFMSLVTRDIMNSNIATLNKETAKQYVLEEIEKINSLVYQVDETTKSYYIFTQEQDILKDCFGISRETLDEGLDTYKEYIDEYSLEELKSVLYNLQQRNPELINILYKAEDDGLLHEKYLAIKNRTYTSDADFEAQMKVIAHRIVLTTAEEVKEIVELPKLKVLNLKENLIEDISPLLSLVELEYLYLGDNEISNIDDIDFSVLSNLRALDLSYNFLSNLLKLNALNKLNILDLSHNKISDIATLNVRSFPNLASLDLSYNQISDIESLKQQLVIFSRKAGYKDNLSAYFAANTLGNVNDGILDLYLNCQELQMEVTVEQDGQMARLAMPAIFSQIEELQPAETSFGITSLHGNVTNDGKEAIVDISRLGTNSAKVMISSSSTNSIGAGTLCDIYYNVVEIGALDKEEEPSVESRSISIQEGKVEGETYQYFVNEEKVFMVDLVNIPREEMANVKITTSDKNIAKVVGITTSETNTFGMSMKFLSAGKVTITISLDYDGISYTDSYEFTVQEELIALYVFGDNELKVGEQSQLRAIFQQDYTTPIDITSNGAVWATSDDSIVTVSSNGLVTAVKAGTASIIVTYTANGKMFVESYDITVTGEYIPDVEEPTDEEVTPEEGTTPDEDVTPEESVTPDEELPSEEQNTVSGVSIATALGDISEACKYELVEDDANIVIKNVSPNTNVTDFVTNLNSIYTVKVYKGEEEVNVQKLATGMTVKLFNGEDAIEPETTITVSVKGDVDGDGYADANDSAIIRYVRADIKKLTGANFCAADINNDGSVDASDSVLLLYHRAGIKGYIL